MFFMRGVALSRKKLCSMSSTRLPLLKTSLPCQGAPRAFATRALLPLLRN